MTAQFHASAKNRNFGLDAARALAICMVLFAHGRHYAGDYSLPGDWCWAVGVAGVGLFFALSGFLIGTILLDMQTKIDQGSLVLRFLARRWLRTLPLYYLALVILILWPMIDTAPVKPVWHYATLTQNMFTPLASNWFGISWSLTIEEWSYLLAPVLAFALFRRSPQPVLCAGLLLCLSGPLLRYLISGPVDFWDNIQRVCVTRTDAIAWGILLAWLLREKPRLLQTWLPVLGGCGLIAVLEFITLCGQGSMEGRPAPNGFIRIFMSSMAGCGMATTLPIFMKFRALPVIEPGVRFVARISYALYLSHFLFMHDHLDFLPERARFPAFIIASVATAVTMSYLVEQPIMRLRPRQFAA